MRGSQEEIIAVARMAAVIMAGRESAAPSQYEHGEKSAHACVEEAMHVYGFAERAVKHAAERERVAAASVRAAEARGTER